MTATPRGFEVAAAFATPTRRVLQRQISEVGCPKCSQPEPWIPQTWRRDRSLLLLRAAIACLRRSLESACAGCCLLTEARSAQACAQVGSTWSSDVCHGTSMALLPQSAHELEQSRSTSLIQRLNIAARSYLSSRRLVVCAAARRTMVGSAIFRVIAVFRFTASSNSPSRVEGLGAWQLAVKTDWLRYRSRQTAGRSQEPLTYRLGDVVDVEIRRWMCCAIRSI